MQLVLRSTHREGVVAAEPVVLHYDPNITEFKKYFVLMKRFRQQGQQNILILRNCEDSFRESGWIAGAKVKP